MAWETDLDLFISSPTLPPALPLLGACSAAIADEEPMMADERACECRLLLDGEAAAGGGVSCVLLLVVGPVVRDEEEVRDISAEADAVAVEESRRLLEGEA